MFDFYTIPIAISTMSATMTTRAEMMEPWIIGRMPAFFMLEREVLRPIAAKAETMRNLLIFLVAATTAVGMVKMLATMDIARKPRMNFR